MDRGGGLKEPEIVEFEEVKCAKFDGNSRLRLQDTTLIKSLKSGQYKHGFILLR